MRRRPAAAFLAVVLLGVVGAYADHGDEHPNSVRQPLYDGCRRSTGETLAGTTPEWVYVNADPTPKRLEGIVTEARPAGDDVPTTHESYDVNWDVLPDPGYKGLISSGDVQAGTIHNEWEDRALPAWARPTAGDHVSVIGSWVWDCGHWGSPSDPRQDPAAWIPYFQLDGVRGEGTEIHPPRALFTVRHDAAGPQGVLSRADLFISSDGTPARMQAECGGSIGIDPKTGEINTASAQQRASGAAGGCSAWNPVNDRDYRFEMPLPSGDGPVAIAVTIRQRENAPEPTVTIEGDVAVVRVPFKGYGEPDASLRKPPMILGATIELARATPAPSRGVRVTLESIRINTNLDTEVPWEQGVSHEPTEYALYAQVSGRWIGLHDLAPGILAARAGTTYDLDHPIDVWLPQDAAASLVNIDVAGRECDLPRMLPCPANEFSFGEVPGTIEWTAESFPTQRLELEATSEGGTAGCGCFTLRWVVEPIE